MCLSFRRTTLVGIGLLVLAVLPLGCDGDPTGILDLIRPGATVNGLLVTKGGADALLIGDFCTFSGEHDVLLLDCAIPAGSTPWIGTGYVAADQATLEFMWAHTEWEMYIDDQRVDLDAFGTFERSLDVGGGVVLPLRGLDVVFQDFEGTHTVRWIFTSDVDLDNGLGEVQPAGRNEQIATIRTGG